MCLLAPESTIQLGKDLATNAWEHTSSSTVGNEEGKGRCDLIIQAHDEKKTSFIIEFKYFKEDKKDFEKALDKLSNEAIQQIKDRRYEKSF